VQAFTAVGHIHIDADVKSEKELGIHQAVTFMACSHCPLILHLPQVRLKAQALASFIAAQHGAQRAYALLTLANKLVNQCEVQVGTWWFLWEATATLSAGQWALSVPWAWPAGLPWLGRCLFRILLAKGC
jgi:hypothetical protein